MPGIDARLKRQRPRLVERPAHRGQSKQAPSPARSVLNPAWAPGASTTEELSASQLLWLQRTAGNRAVESLLGRPIKPVQRVSVGWEGAEGDSWNAGAKTVNAEGKEAAAGEAGVVRIPVSGIAAGHTGATANEVGGDSDPNIHKPKDWKPSKKGEKFRVAVSSVTSEAAGAKSGGEAIVIVPTGLPPGKVDILFHLHGHTIGYRQAKHKKGAAPPPRDVMYDRIEQQLLAAARENFPMIGILPQGSFYSKFGAGDKAGINADAFVNDVFGLGLNELKGLSPGGVTLSGWSGAGKGITEMMAGSKAAAKKGAAAPTAQSPLLPTNDFEGLFLFDAIYGDWLKTIWGWLEARLNAELTVLAGKTAGTPAQTAAAQEAWIKSSGFRFRGIYTHKGGCLENYETLRDTHLAGWFSSKAAGALAGSVRDALRANYVVAGSGKGVQHNVMIGKQGGANQENLLKAIEMLPPHPKTAGAQGRTATTGPGKTRAAAPAPVPAAGQPSVSSGASADQLLIESAVALGRPDAAKSKTAGGTLLSQDDVRAALTNRAKDATFDARFKQAQTALAAVPAGPGRAAAAQTQAKALVRALELRFILDPTRSALDLLPADRATHWKEFGWETYDYPGQVTRKVKVEGKGKEKPTWKKVQDPKGAHEDEARAMTGEMTKVRPERRPNKGSEAVMVEADATPERWKYIAEHSPAVSGESGARLYQDAGDSFVKMKEAAKADGVNLHILSSFRTPERAAANAAAAGSSESTARFSSHSLGLAMDLEMGVKRELEISTVPMQSVLGMRALAPHKWMVFRGEEFGWYPYGHEPWHWEYNPPGLKDRYFDDATKPAAKAAVEKKVAPKAVDKPAAEKKAAAKAVVKPAAGPTPATTATPAAASPEKLSGAHWVAKYPTSRSVDDLIDPFKSNLSSFIAMLSSNGATVKINATYRPAERAWLMHWAWAIAKGKIAYNKLSTIKNPLGIDIVWDHGDKASSKAAAAAMVAGYQMAHTAALASRHTERRAVDMSIKKLPEFLKIPSGEVAVGTAAANQNQTLWMVAESNYSVVKLPKDPPHWSEDGR
jgi:D-alanyl-D-alanine carboxypeptidase-like protein